MRKSPLCTLLLLASLFSSKQAAAQSFLVDIENVMLNPGERVVGFDFKVTSGYVSMVQAPPGWQIEIDNDPSQNVEISGSIFVGAAAINCERLNRMITVTQTLVFEKMLEITGNVTITKDFDHTRTITLAPRNIILKPTP